MPGQNYVKVFYLFFFKFVSSFFFFPSWFRMKSKPWFSSRTARPASNWTRSSLQLPCPKWPQTPRTIFTLPSPVTVRSPKTLLATTLTWKRLPAPSSTPRARPTVLKLHTAPRSEPPRCSAVAMAPCLPGIQVWNLLSLQEMTSVKKDRGGKVAVSPMAERTQRHSWQGAGSSLAERRLSNQRRQTSWSTSREQPGMSAVFARGKCKFFFASKILCVSWKCSASIGKKKSYFLCSVGSSSNVLTSWAQRQKLRSKKTKTGRSSSQTPEYLEKPCGFRESPKRSPPQGPDSQEQVLLTLL